MIKGNYSFYDECNLNSILEKRKNFNVQNRKIQLRSNRLTVNLMNITLNSPENSLSPLKQKSCSPSKRKQ
jgi:hypothetical protein